MFERFTKRARHVVVFAQDEARALRHNSIGSEHLLLGLLREEDGVAARALASLAITIDDVRGEIVRLVGRGDAIATGAIPFTGRAKGTLELALREALALGSQFIGTEHLLLGLTRLDEGVAAQILLALDADPAAIRRAVVETLAS